MIRAYPRTPSVFPGDELLLHVATTSQRFRVEFFRQGPLLERVAGMGAQAFEGQAFPDGPPDHDWGWPGYAFRIPDDWRSGVYLAVCIEIDADSRETSPDCTTTFGTDSKALFVVRSRGPVPADTVLYKVSWATFVAYNATVYGSLYAEAVWSRERPHPGFKVTWRRPGCGTGGLVMPGDSVDYYDPSSRRQCFEHWDAPFVRWLERSGYPLHYCTDWDLHRDPALLKEYSLLLSVGHDEYWSDSMRAAIDAHVGRGGNVAFFSGNISYHRIHFTDDDTAITCAKVIPGTGEPEAWTRDFWSEVNPEARLTGVTYRFGGGWWDGRRQTLGYTVQHAAHWAFDGTDLREGDVFGQDEAFPLIGYEADGADFRRQQGRAIVTGELGTPKDFVILGVAELGEGWVTGRAAAAATMGLYVTPRGGIVFQAATTDWPIVAARNPVVERITRNVIDRLRLPSVRLLGPLPALGGRMLAQAGATASFHVDTAGLQRPGETLDVEWHVAGASASDLSGPVVRIEMPREPDFVTVSAVVRCNGKPAGFGTRTLLPLSATQAAQVQVLVDLRDMVLSGDPSVPLVNPAYDPVELSPEVFGIRIPWMKDRAARIQAVTARLAELMRQHERPGDEQDGPPPAE